MLEGVLSSFWLVALAEFGDKSQIACLVLASRYGPKVVFVAAILAFLILNLIAVAVGAATAALLPEFWVAVGVAALFLLFGVQTLRSSVNSELAEYRTPAAGALIATFSLIFLAELGDKTQLSVAGLSANSSVPAVYFGASAALILTTAVAVWAGQWLARSSYLNRIHQAGGLLMLGFALWIVLTRILPFLATR